MSLSTIFASIHGMLRPGLMGLMASISLVGAANAATVNVSNFGDEGWYSDDTRDAAGTNLVGSAYTNAGKPGQTPTGADDVAIAQQIQFVPGPAGSTYGGAVSIDGTSGNNGKSNISAINLAGFDDASNLLTTFGAEYQWYDFPNGTSRTLAFKLGIQSTSWGTGPGQSQNGFTATRSGESAWDLVLVNVGLASDLIWTTVDVDHDSGSWALFRQAGNAFFPAPGAAQTLDAWALDSTFGPLLFGAGAKVTSIQFGLGSAQRNSIAYLDYLQTNLLNGGDVVNFGPAVPEPSTFALVALGALGLGVVAGRRNRRQ